jgi:hypothetical protein
MKKGQFKWSSEDRTTSGFYRSRENIAPLLEDNNVERQFKWGSEERKTSGIYSSRENIISRSRSHVNLH